MGDFGCQLLEAPLPVQHLGSKQVLVVIIERLALQIFVGSVAERHGSACQYVIHPTT